MKNLYEYVYNMESIMMNDKTGKEKLNDLTDIKCKAYKDKSLDGIAYEILCKLYFAYMINCENLHMQGK